MSVSDDEYDPDRCPTEEEIAMRQEVFMKAYGRSSYDCPDCGDNMSFQNPFAECKTCGFVEGY